MKTYTIAILLLLIASACAPAVQPPVQPSEPTVENNEIPVEEIVTPPEPEKEVLEQANPQIVSLTARSEDIEGYKFTIARLPKKSGDDAYWVFDQKAKIKLATIRQMGEWAADYVYVDFDAKTAYAYCLELASCRVQNRSAGVPFEDYAITLPKEWIEPALYGERGGSVQFNSRPVTIVTWQTDDGKYYEAYLDNYYGFPQRVAIATDETMKNVIGGYEYQQLAFGVTADDVKPPY